jgi:DNA ligase-associated metallophosphoesterase
VTAAPITLAGERVLLDPAGVAFWPARKMLAVADLHLEKGSFFATRGQALPPYDSRATLDRLWRLVRLYRPATLVCLGDSFHDSHGHARLAEADRDRIKAIAALTSIIWVLGNHDPAPPGALPGQALLAHAAGRVSFRHEGGAGTPEVCGHHHPKARIFARAKHVVRPCFVVGHGRLMLPAFGAFTGGLDVTDPAIGKLFRRGGRVFLLGQDRLFSFPLAQAAAPVPA